MTYWAHCRDCGDHFETKTGTCPGCRLDNTHDVETGAELGTCYDCKEHAFLNRQIEAAERRMAKWPVPPKGGAR